MDLILKLLLTFLKNREAILSTTKEYVLTFRKSKPLLILYCLCEEHAHAKYHPNIDKLWPTTWWTEKDSHLKKCLEVNNCWFVKIDWSDWSTSISKSDWLLTILIILCIYCAIKMPVHFTNHKSIRIKKFNHSINTFYWLVLVLLMIISFSKIKFPIEIPARLWCHWKPCIKDYTVFTILY